ncbi:MAG: hypothetical protein ABEI78_01245, partial [Candidatus Nanohaloarchaea archaeon]
MLKGQPLDLQVNILETARKFKINVLNGSVKTGGKTVFKVKVTNPSNNTYENVEAKLFTSDPLSTSDDTSFTSNLTPGETEIFS